jgi:hypothetical protein
MWSLGSALPITRQGTLALRQAQKLELAYKDRYG